MLVTIINCAQISLISRPSQDSQEKSERPGRSGDVIRLRGCVSPPTRPHNGHDHGLATWLSAWVSGWKYATVPQTASDYITRLTRPSWFFLRTLKNMGRPGYEAILRLKLLRRRLWCPQLVETLAKVYFKTWVVGGGGCKSVLHKLKVCMHIFSWIPEQVCGVSTMHLQCS